MEGIRNVVGPGRQSTSPIQQSYLDIFCHYKSVLAATSCVQNARVVMHIMYKYSVCLSNVKQNVIIIYLSITCHAVV